MHVGIDLHIHTTASDGSFSPFEVLDIARRIGLDAIAITDHDTIEGAREARQVRLRGAPDLLNGVEISAAPPPAANLSGSMHILGYGFDLDDANLNRALEKSQKARNDRNPRIIEHLNRLGFQICLQDVVRNAGKDQISRPHIAQVMVQKNIVASIDDAFDAYLAPGRPAYVDKYRIPVAGAIQLIHGAGGIAVLAHPGLLEDQRPATIESLVVELKQMGLGGLEVYYPEHSPGDTALFKQLAVKHALLMTGGTDFHGRLIPEIQMGCGRGDFYVPGELYAKLVAALQPR